MLVGRIGERRGQSQRLSLLCPALFASLRWVGVETVPHVRKIARQSFDLGSVFGFPMASQTPVASLDRRQSLAPAYVQGQEAHALLQARDGMGLESASLDDQLPAVAIAHDVTDAAGVPVEMGLMVPNDPTAVGR